MAHLVAKSPTEWEYVLDKVKHFLVENLENIKTIRVISRCGSCYKKNVDTKIDLEYEDVLTIKDWRLNCNMNKKEYSHETTIQSFDPDNVFIHVNKNNKHGFYLSFEYYTGSSIEVPLTPNYDYKDYEVHGTMLYGDRNLKLIERSLKNGHIIMLQNFIDFKGLDPMYSQTIIVEYLDPEENE